MFETLEEYNDHLRYRANNVADLPEYAMALRTAADANIGYGHIDYHHNIIRVTDGFGGVVFEGSRDDPSDVALVNIIANYKATAEHNAVMIELLRNASNRAEHYYRELVKNGVYIP